MIRIFSFLEDGAWHDLKEIAWKMRIPVEDLSDYCETLFKREIVECDTESCRVRIGSEFLNMITVLSVGSIWEKVAQKGRRDSDRPAAEALSDPSHLYAKHDGQS
jgi:DNA-binding IclR family transcriptional regulator